MIKLVHPLIVISFLFANHVFSQEDFTNPHQDTTIINTSLGRMEITGYNYSKNNQSYVKINTTGYCDLGVYKNGIFQEAETRGIFKDKVYVEFLRDSSCNFVDIKILKKGKLESFNLYAEQWCKVLEEKLSEINNSLLVGKDNEYYQCDTIRLPLTLVLEN